MTTEPTRLGYSITNPAAINTEVVLDPSVSPVGTAIAAGNWMVAFITGTNTTTGVTPPAGWTQILSFRLVGTETVSVYAKIRVAGETNYTFLLAPQGGASTGATLMWGSGADTNLSHWIVGAVTNRASSGASATNWAETLTTSVDKTLVLTLSTERTSAATPVPTLTGTTAWYRMPEGNVNQIQTIDIGYIDKPVAGATGRATINYGTAVQGSNGLAFQLAIPPVPDAAPTGLPGVYVDPAGVSHNGYLFYNDSANVKHPVSLPTVKYQPYTVSQMFKAMESNIPWYGLHRGGSYNYPEETLDGYRGCVQRGAKILEISVQYSQDGTPWCFHDSTTTRTTGVAGTISAMTDVQLAALSNLGSTAAGNPTQRSRPTAKLVDVIAAYKDTHVMIVEDKTYTHVTSLLSLLSSYGTAGRPAGEIFIVKMDGTGNKALFTQARTAGFKTWGYIFDADMAAKYVTALTQGMDMIGLDYNSSDSVLTPAIAQAFASGVIPTGHIVPNRTIRNRLLGLGLKGMMMSNVDAIF